MLQSVYIENIALIRRLEIEPSSGFCAFTGETGAGKSIIIDSLGLLCGARSDKEIIRTGEEEALVEGIFTVNNENTAKILAENEVFAESDGTVTVTRKLTRDGRSQAKINGRNVPLSRLKNVMSALLSIHGQQDTQAFADTERQMQLLDSFAKNDDIKNEYCAKYNKYRRTLKKINDLSQDEHEKAMRTDMLKYRISELKSAAVYKGEKDELESERRLLANREKIISRCGNAYDMIYEREGSASEALKNAYDLISSLEGIIPEADDLSKRLDSAKYEIIDIAETLKQYTDNDGENSSARLDEVETRIELIKRLENKYKTDADGFASLLEEWSEELDAIEHSEEELIRLENELKSDTSELKKAARALTDSREEASGRLCRLVTGELCALDMPSVAFTVGFSGKDYAPDGADEAEFLISANKGEQPKPMSKIASGGELSRMMLCLKCVFADSESIGTLIFDEIDAGISGSTSEKLGIRLKRAADGGKTQVICVTHSAIIASKADAHYKISKSVVGDRTETKVEKLDHNGRKDELARIIGGLDITDTVMKAAEELLKRK